MAPRKPKQIGTADETTVVRYLQTNGFPHAERRALRGSHDLGDITGCPGLVFEVKGGDRARNASDAQVETWLWETETERQNARADYGILIVARTRKNVRDWWAVIGSGDIAPLLSPAIYATGTIFDDIPFRTPLHHIVDLLRANGYGQPPGQQIETATTGGT